MTLVSYPTISELTDSSTRSAGDLYYNQISIKKKNILPCDCIVKRDFMGYTLYDNIMELYMIVFIFLYHS